MQAYALVYGCHNKSGNDEPGDGTCSCVPVCEVVLGDVVRGEVLVGLWKSSPIMQYGSQIWTWLEVMMVDKCVAQGML